ncbi:MAG: beta-lactamase family protein, partial [Actinomycetota bacterium]|nr:beta-lactamase family protein [Actinomycetota bacterium]
LSNVHSVTKSVVATLAGLAIRNGSLAFETRLDELFDERLFRGDEQKRRISIEHLLTMTAGLDGDTPHDIDEIADRGGSWIAGPLAAPLVAEPGTRFSYNNGAAHVLGAAIARATETPLVRFAEEQLFTPLGVSDYRWPTDPDGNALGYGHLELRPRDLLRLGLFYLDAGRWNGLQLLPESFIAAATTPHSAGGPPEGTSYGYLWWITEDGGHRSFFAGGYGGQYVTVIPELALVVATTGDVDVFTETSRNLRRLVSEIVVPTFAG